MTGQGAREEEREALATVIRAAFLGTPGYPPDDEDRSIADAVFAAGYRKRQEPEITGSASQRVTELLGTDDWVIVHRGDGLVTDTELDTMEAQR